MTVTPAWDSYVDAEAVCVEALAGLDAQVTLIGATMPAPNVVEASQVQIDNWAASKKAARDAAYASRSRLLALQTTDPAKAGRVTVTQGPSYLPEPDGQPRYVTTVTITNRAKRTP